MSSYPGDVAPTDPSDFKGLIVRLVQRYLE